MFACSNQQLATNTTNWDSVVLYSRQHLIYQGSQGTKHISAGAPGRVSAKVAGHLVIWNTCTRKPIFEVAGSSCGIRQMAFFAIVLRDMWVCQCIDMCLFLFVCLWKKKLKGVREQFVNTFSENKLDTPGTAGLDPEHSTSLCDHSTEKQRARPRGGRKRNELKQVKKGQRVRVKEKWACLILYHLFAADLFIHGINAWHCRRAESLEQAQISQPKWSFTNIAFT